MNFPAAALQQGFNAVDLETDWQLKAFIFADDVYYFGRSFYKPTGDYEWLTQGFDLVTYRTQPSLHIGGREFKIRIALPVRDLEGPPTR